jgi:hypothetical protein
MQVYNFNSYSKIDDSYDDAAINAFALDELVFWSTFTVQIAIMAQLIQQPTTLSAVFLSTISLTLAVRCATSVNRRTADGSISLIGSIVLVVIVAIMHFRSYHMTSRIHISMIFSSSVLLWALVLAHVADGDNTSIPTVLHGKLAYLTVNCVLINMWFWLIYSNNSTFVQSLQTPV